MDGRQLASAALPMCAKVFLSFQRGQYLFRVPVRFHVLKDLGDLAIGANNECSARNPQELLPVHALFFHHAVCGADLLVHVGEKGVRQVVFLLELLLLLRRVSRDAQHDGAGLLDLFECVAEPARFYRSTGGVCLREEKEDDILAGKVFQ